MRGIWERFISLWVKPRKIKRKKEQNNHRDRYYGESRYDVKHADRRTVAARVNAITNQLYTQSEKQERQDRGRKTREIITLCALIAAGFFAFGSDALLYRQLIDARIAAGTQHTDTERALSVATIANGETKRTADAAFLQAKIADQAFRRTHRPWIAFETMQPITTKIKFTDAELIVSLDIRYRNGGSAVAIGTRFDQKLHAEPFPDISAMGPYGFTPQGMAFLLAQYGAACDDSLYRMLAATDGTLLLPGGASSALDNGVNIRAIPRGSFKVNGVGKVAVWFNVCIMYRDEFGQHHATSAILYFVADNGEKNVIPSGEIAGKFIYWTLGMSAY